MKFRIAPRALAEAKRTKTWWRANREAAPDLFEMEFEEMLERIIAAPDIGASYEGTRLAVVVRRVLLPKSGQHVYYAVNGDEVMVLSVWSAHRERGPRL
jgi:plasmid stabilization system protein ParE